MGKVGDAAGGVAGKKHSARSPAETLRPAAAMPGPSNPRTCLPRGSRQGFDNRDRWAAHSPPLLAGVEVVVRPNNGSAVH